MTYTGMVLALCLLVRPRVTRGVYTGMRSAAIYASDTRLARAAFRPVGRLTLGELRGELVRKSLHMLIALVPTLVSSLGVLPTMSLLSGGVLFFAAAEYLRLHGRSVALVTSITIIASRPRDRDRFVFGPVTLATGTMLALMLYPAPAASVAIYALAFGDGLASLVGRAIGRVSLVFGKTVEGSIACFVAVFLSASLVTGRVGLALVVAAVAMIIEVLPSNDLDNVLLPVGVGFVTAMLL